MFLSCFLIFAYFQPHVSYKHVSYKKESVMVVVNTFRARDQCCYSHISEKKISRGVRDRVFLIPA